MIQYDGRRGKSASVIPAPIKGGAFGKSQAGAEEFSVVCWITEAPDTETEGLHPERKKEKSVPDGGALSVFIQRLLKRL